MENIPTYDVIIVQADFNTRAGSKNEGRERTTGKEYIGYITENGCRLCDFCEEKDLVI